MNAVPLIIPLTVPPAPDPIIEPVEPFREFIRACVVDATTPDLFSADVMNASIAAPRPVVPAVEGSAMLIPIPPIITEIPNILPSRVPSAASFIIAVTIADDELIPALFEN